ncbi:hypothetical protein [Methylorubrum suomiense]|uniref:hypothetical protein n=1 Tax=Methylorubrum suomiense TaxID=144191 RepID=UPI001EE24F74|nr:hypothetical protein [Methylorubrum suomiense]
MKPLPLIDGTGGARLPIKPALGQPCNGCGWYCASEPCAIARKFIGDDEGRARRSNGTARGSAAG